jgi:hypothetical protein
MIPNRDSIPQNHPRPKDAVSKTDAAAASMAGIAGDSVSILYARLISASVFFDSWIAGESIVGEQAHRTDSIPSKHKHQVASVQHLFFIDVPFLSATHHVSGRGAENEPAFDRYNQTIITN